MEEEGVPKWLWKRGARVDPGFWEGGGSNKYIHKWGGLREGRFSPVTVRGEASAAFLTSAFI